MSETEQLELDMPSHVARIYGEPMTRYAVTCGAHLWRADGAVAA
ncbi:MAG: hypothetical protein H6R18_2723 [Proteobacteria bacterium]|nr:hypothetical protein [Pseudomonadota bacterium]